MNETWRYCRRGTRCSDMDRLADRQIARSQKRLPSTSKIPIPSTDHVFTVTVILAFKTNFLMFWPFEKSKIDFHSLLFSISTIIYPNNRISENLGEGNPITLKYQRKYDFSKSHHCVSQRHKLLIVNTDKCFH